MKLSLHTLLAVALALGPVAAAAKKDGESKQRRKLDERLLAQAFGAVQSEFDASRWKEFQSDGPVEVDHNDGIYDVIESAATQAAADELNRKLWYDYPPKPPKAGWYAIDVIDTMLEVKNKKNEQCFYKGEGIGRDEWKFGITTAKVPMTNMTNVTAYDTYLMLFEEWHPYQPVYKAFKGAKQLCIGEKKGNIAYLYVVYEKGIYYLIGYPDAGRDDHLPKLKIRDRDCRRQRMLREERGADGQMDVENTDEKEEENERELWSYKSSCNDAVVRFRDGPGDHNWLWQIWSNGDSKTSPYARWYHFPQLPKTCDDVWCPEGKICDPDKLTCRLKTCDDVVCDVGLECDPLDLICKDI
mmetsp:Transcript_13086/g.28384  ORF Transcript_13086/g.28384 Transcript_13086/m.28384 type:complete len:356 (+) Transcript_13086:60-1127(+)